MVRELVLGQATGARSTDTVFLQVGKLEPRKGQRELLRAFEAAFTPADAVQLVLHCYNPFMARSAFDELSAPFRTSSMRNRITLMSRELPTAQDVARLMAGADCGVFAVRAEGWNLEALEMLSMGKTVIATDTTAHTAFLTTANARLIRVDAMEPALNGAVTGSWAAWGESQHEQLVAHLQSVHDERQRGALPLNTAGIDTATRLSWDASADALLAALATA
jgi:glycosyltransferase involved in cell wall biosynthesis